MSDLLGVGLIGAGKIGRVHAHNLAHHVSGTRLVAFADPREAVTKALGQQLGVGSIYPGPEDLLADGAVDAVVIASPTPTHAQLLTDAASAGKHIFCEKPIALDLRLIDTALDRVNRAGVTLQVGFQRRFDRSFREARDLVARGSIGRPWLVRITSRDPEPAPIEYLRSSGGLFLDMTIHDFDMARFLIDDEVDEVSAVGAVLVDPAIGRDAEDIDTAIVTLRFAGGALGVIDNCRHAAYGYDQRAEIFGSEGVVTVENKECHQTVLTSAAGVRRANAESSLSDRYADAYAAELQAFVDAVRDGRPSEVGGRDARLPVAVGLAALRSAEERRPVLVSSVEPSGGT